jgi:hypothetical protein
MTVAGVYRRIAIIVLLVSGSARGDELVARLDNPEQQGLEEVYSDEVPVSGRVVAGVVLTGVYRPGDMVIYPRDAEAGSRVCVQVMSRDGRYWAENNFRLPAENTTGPLSSINEPVSLQYDSRYDSELRLFEADDLAVLSSPRECGAKGSDSYFPATHTRVTGANKALLVYINSGRADSFVRVTNRTSVDKPHKCRRFTEGRRTGYDTLCEVALLPSDAALEALDISIYRRKYDKNLKKENLHVWLPRIALTGLDSSAPR